MGLLTVHISFNQSRLQFSSSPARPKHVGGTNLENNYLLHVVYYNLPTILRALCGLEQPQNKSYPKVDALIQSIRDESSSKEQYNFNFLIEYWKQGATWSFIKKKFWNWSCCRGGLLLNLNIIPCLATAIHSLNQKENIIKQNGC